MSLFDINRPGGSTIISDKDRDCSCEDNNQSSTIRTDFKALNQNTPAPNASAEMGQCMLKIGKFEEGRSLIQKTDGSISL